MGFPKQEDWRGVPFPSPRDLPDTGIKPTSHALAGGFFTTELPGEKMVPDSKLCPVFPKVKALSGDLILMVSGENWCLRVSVPWTQTSSWSVTEPGMGGGRTNPSSSSSNPTQGYGEIAQSGGSLAPSVMDTGPQRQSKSLCTLYMNLLTFRENLSTFLGFPGGSNGNESTCNAGRSNLGLIPGSGRSRGEGNGHPVQYSCLENPMDRGACQTTGSQSWTQLSNLMMMCLYL